MNRITGSLVTAVVFVGCIGTSAFAQGVEQRLEVLEAQFAAALDAITALEAANATLQTEVGDLQMGFSLAEQRLIDAEQRLTDLESSGGGDVAQRLTDLEANSVLELDGLLFLDQTGPTAMFKGVNVQVVNGLDSTESINGLGNLIVGYDEATGFFGRGAVCSDGQFDDQTTCVQNQEVWAISHKTGSHNLVVGTNNNYPQAGGVVFGAGNTASRMFATVTGGNDNLARGMFASVSGGLSNTASSDHAAVSGGFFNTASGIQSSVTGGVENVADGLFATVSGGRSNRASGGDGSTGPFGGAASVSGGEQNVADDANSAVSGGSMRVALNGAWVAGSLIEPF